MWRWGLLKKLTRNLIEEDSSQCFAPPSKGELMPKAPFWLKVHVISLNLIAFIISIETEASLFALAKLSIGENLVMTSPYVCTSVRTLRVAVSRNEFLPFSPREFCPLLFQKPLEMIDISESVNWPNVWWILGADHFTFEGVMGDLTKNVLQTDFERKKPRK